MIDSRTWASILSARHTKLPRHPEHQAPCTHHALPATFRRRKRTGPNRDGNTHKDPYMPSASSYFAPGPPQHPYSAGKHSQPSDPVPSAHQSPFPRPTHGSYCRCPHPFPHSQRRIHSSSHPQHHARGRVVRHAHSPGLCLLRRVPHQSPYAPRRRRALSRGRAREDGKKVRGAGFVDVRGGREGQLGVRG